MLEQDKKLGHLTHGNKKGWLKKAQANYILKHNLYVLIVRLKGFFLPNFILENCLKNINHFISNLMRAKISWSTNGQNLDNLPKGSTFRNTMQTSVVILLSNKINQS